MRVSAAKYPVGIQTFAKIIKDGQLYADKTAIIYKIVHSLGYVFLSRPRRFGKSLLCSTLKSYFEGERELFRGLAIEKLETEWKKHPVIRIDLSNVKEVSAEETAKLIGYELGRIEEQFGIEKTSDNPGARLQNLIESVHRQTGEKAVVIIDEYDAPLLNVLHDDDELPKVRQLMRTLYSPLKKCDPLLRFVFITGITKFSQLSIFSELNNLANISMLPEYATLCGITQRELEHTTFSDGVDDLAEAYETTRAEMLDKLRENYDGYCFAGNAEGVYNPFSLLTALKFRKVDSYWFASGTPTFLVEQMRRFNTDLAAIDGSRAAASDFDAPTEGMETILPLLYQSGYITIKGYNPLLEVFTLGIPNKEVRVGLMRSLSRFYVAPNPLSTSNAVLTACEHLLEGKPDEAMKSLRVFFASIPYQDDVRRHEGHYRAMLYVVFSLMEAFVGCEVRTSSGRIDVLVRVKDYTYVMECKLNGTAQAALEQINSKDYAIPWQADGRKVVKVGINFSTETGTIEQWVVEDHAY